MSAERFGAAQTAAFFAQVLINDRVDPETALPATIRLDYSAEQLARCYGLARQVWEEVDRPALRALVAALARRGTLDAAQRLAFKHDRAKFKQLRFAYATGDARHRYPRLLHLVTATMGHLQDDLRNGRPRAVRARAALLRLLLGRAADRRMRQEAAGFVPSAPDTFRAYVRDQLRAAGAAAAQPDITAKAFHDVRKIISRQSAFYLALDTLYPSAEHRLLFRYLSAINGLMGALHDDLVARRITGAQDYHADRFALPEDIRRRLAAIAERFAAAA